MNAPLEIAPFRAEITPPLGHPLCAGWYPPAQALTDRLTANGVVLYPLGELPIILCALDWAELSNGEHRQWLHELASAAGTLPERVALHCIHAHDAPWPDRDAQTILDQLGHPEILQHRSWSDAVPGQVAQAIRTAPRHPVDTIRAGRAEVHEIASNRRIISPEGKSLGVRWTRCRDAALRAEPEGVIDPWLKTVSFWHEGKKQAALHYYAVHPTSYDGTGEITHDFVGIAREQLAAQENTPHLYFTECAGDITPGKYNDGQSDNRALFAARIAAAMQEAEANATPFTPGPVRWENREITLPPYDPSGAEAILADPAASSIQKSRAALILAYRQRQHLPISVGTLHLGDRLAIVHLPGEAFMGYQLYAQSLRPDRFVIVPAYGDCGPGYIPLARSYAEGGYEPTDAFCSPESEAILKRAIAETLA